MDEPGILVEGGDLACGELLMVVHRRIRGEPPGTVVRIASTDPAGPIDIPAWCHLTGHHYLGRAPDLPDHYLVKIAESSRRVQAADPWRLAPTRPTPSDPI